MINEAKLNKISRKLSKILRHDSEGLTMTKDGWIKVDELTKYLVISKTELDWIVEKNDKKRFSYDRNQIRIRASQGHSLDVSITMKVVDDIDILYHGTSMQLKQTLLKEGLKPMSRKHVHLSKDIETAKKVGLRKSSDLLILQIDAKAMIEDGIQIYISENGVYLTNFVDPKYIKIK